MRDFSTAAMDILGKLLLLSVSFVLCVLAAELVARVMFDPVDYLNPTLVDDEFLNHRIEGYTGGHDDWGFRNARRPETVDIVCIGDSMTYGMTALSRESWPAVLAKLRGDAVYNMGLGGYGPIQYLHLMQTMAVRLHPKTVIVGLYFGNDFFDVYNLIRFNKNWSSYVELGGAKVEGGPFVLPRQHSGKFLGELRDWLSKNSVFYAVVTQRSVFSFIREHEFAAFAENQTENLITYSDNKRYAMFNLDPRLRFLDMRDPRIKTAMEIMPHVMSDMRTVAEKESMRLIVALIPTKERVYGKLLERAGYRDKYSRVADALDQEDAARAALVGVLRDHDIEFVDLLPALEAEIENRDLFPRTDPHLNKDGYRVIAETINRYLSRPH
jgi:hypothetical protein